MKRLFPIFNELAIQNPKETIPVADLWFVLGSFENDDLLKKSKNEHLLSKNDEKQESSGHV